MYWIILILAGLCECTFTFCLGKTRGTAGMEYALWLGGFFAFSALSMLLLMKATQQIPLVPPTPSGPASAQPARCSSASSSSTSPPPSGAYSSSPRW